METIGLIAGNGSFPLLFAQAAKERGVRVVAVGMRGETEPGIVELVDQLTWVRVGQLGKMIRAFVKAGVHHAAMAGGVRKTRLFSRARPDLTGLRLLVRHSIRRDDGLLRAVAAEFERNEITIVDSTIYMPEALAPAGLISGPEPTPEQQRDLSYGLSIAREIGRLDIGQTAVVHRGAVVALEGMEGTDECIRRAGTLIGGGGVVVKVAKPNQDMRFDVPAVGPKTIEALRDAKMGALGIEAGRTVFVESQRFLEAADAAGLTVVGLTEAAPDPTLAEPEK